MPVNHKFRDVLFTESFQTSNSILTVTPYKPEILILGTFNPDTDINVNMADFFYGRNWFWPCVFNIFEFNSLVIQTQRKFTSPYNPSLEAILDISEKLKFTFADFVQSVFCNTDEAVIPSNASKFKWKNKEYDLINDGDLSKLDDLNQIFWSTDSIIKYLNINPQIHTIYFTRQITGVWAKQMKKIELSKANINIRCIYTPSGQGLKGKPRFKALVQHWLFNKHDKYDTIDLDLILSQNVNTDEFKDK